ncbi:MAG: hypothetical protein OXE95_05360 [Chloroflexi bacterium]|nr:hypothetical protein [Chloroflexota bacterium]MCY4246991.1 hypothetical protein [Chloroflexota bacterium]
MNASESLPGVIFVMIGPGGAGKNAIMRAIIADSPSLRQLPTATTRPMRLDEEQGREHHFMSMAAFKKLLSAGQLLEYQEVTPGKFYGVPRQLALDCLRAGKARIADIEALGAKKLAAAFPQNVVQIFVTVPGANMAAQLTVLAERMRQRADAITDISCRLQRAEAIELPYQSQCDHIIVNDRLSSAIAAARRIIDRELAARHLPEATA